MVLAGCGKGMVLEAHLSSRREVAAGSMRPSSSASMTSRRLSVKLQGLPIASSSRSRCTGTPRTSPRAAQATAASSSSRGGSPSPSWMQRRRAHRQGGPLSALPRLQAPSARLPLPTP